jgi:hypothetical protein
MNTNTKSVNLPYNYAIINAEYRCTGCKTYSYEVPLDNFIPVPDASDVYLGKYYNPSTDLWYIDSSMTVEADDVNAMYHG